MSNGGNMPDVTSVSYCESRIYWMVRVYIKFTPIFVLGHLSHLWVSVRLPLCFDIFLRTTRTILTKYVRIILRMQRPELTPNGTIS